MAMLGNDSSPAVQSGITKIIVRAYGVMIHCIMGKQGHGKYEGTFLYALAN